MTKGVIYYTDNRPDPKLLKKCQDNIRSAFDGEIVAASLKPIDFGDKRLVFNNLERGYLTMFTQILGALESSSADIIYHCEHDNMYPIEHFAFNPPEEKVYYNNNWWKIRDDGFAIHWEADQVSGMCGPRQLLIDWYKQRIASFDPENFDRKFEPYSGEGAGKWMSEVPYLDIRGKWNLTYNKWGLKDFRKKETAVNLRESTVDKIPGWDILNLKELNG